MNKFLRKCLWFLGFISAAASAQNVRITGKVIAREDGSALPGVSVAVRGTSTGTVTNAQGIYSLNVPSKNTTVSFSFIGYIRKDTTAAASSNLNITLSPDSKQLQEVVVTTALGIKRKAKELGYATQTVSAKDLTTSKPTNIAQGLSGKVAGLQITQANNQIDAGDQIRVVLRGNRSFQGNNQALLVVDGVTSNLSYLNSLNPNDVESVNVLKGATAAALYGSEASNGVIIVTTKRGNTDGGGSFSFTNTTMFNKVSYLPKLQTTFGGGTDQDAFGFPQYTPFENQNFGDRFDGSLRPIGRPLADGTSQMVTYENRSDEKRKFFNTGLDVQNDVTYSGGDKNGSMFANIQHLETKGVVPGDKANRTSIRLNGTRNYKDRLNINYSIDYTQRNYDKSSNQVYNNVINTPAEIPLTEYKDLNSTWGNPNNFYNDYYQSPYFGLQDQRQKERKDQLLGNISLGYKATSWLDLLVRGGLSTTYILGKYTQAAFTYSDYAKSIGKSIALNDILSSTSSYDEFDTRYNGDFLATFHKNVKDFSFRAIIGSQLTDQQQHKMGVGASNLVIPDFFNVSNVSGIPSASESILNYRTLGFFGDLTVGYKDWLFLHASGRQDKDSRLARGNRQFFYPALDGSFVFTDAIPALKNNHILSSGKLRAGISKVYTVQLDPYQLAATFSPGTGFPYGNVAGFTLGNNVYDANLKPEKTVQKEIGLDLGFFDNRITLETSAYTGVTSDQEIKQGINISNATGFTNAVINTGSGRTRGIEVAIAASPIISLSNGFRWNLSVNYSYNDNKVLSVYQGLDQLSIGNNNFIIIGKNYPQLVGSDYARDPQGRVIVSPVTGLPSQANTNVIFGQTNPKHILGLTTSFQFKSFTLAGTAEMRSGAYLYNGFASTLDFSGISYTSAETGRQRFVYPNSVIQTSPGVFVPNTNITTNNGSGSFWADGIRNNIMSNYVTSADFIKIRELSLSYDVPARYLRGQKIIKKASIGLIGRNLFMFRPKSNIYTDPEINAQTDNAQGVNNLNQTPPTRLYGFTASIGF